MNKILITTGDPNGIGAEITIKALEKMNITSDKIALVSNTTILDFYGFQNKQNYEIIEIPYEQKDITPGEITKEAGEFSFQSLKAACNLSPKAIVTAPISKEALHKAGHIYNGQTEILEHYLAQNNQKAEMLFVAEGFRVLLLTRHCALKDIDITPEILENKIKNIVNVLQKEFNIENPNLALCGLNPHSGENGIIGDEEIKIFIPTVEKLRKEGINITNPLPADTLFVNAAKHYFQNTKDKYDCYIANYHDQGLIPIKTVAGYNTVNTTIGLNIIRTSPGHGTAFDIANKNMADETSMVQAIKLVLNKI